LGLHPGLAQWGLTQRDDTFLMQCVPTIQNSTRNRADFFKSCTRLKDLAQLSQGVFIGKQAFFPGFLPCKNVALPHSFSDHHSHASCVEELRCAAFGTNLRDLWHKVAQALAPRLTNWQAFNGPYVLFCRQRPDPTLAMDVSASSLFRLQERQEAPLSRPLDPGQRSFNWIGTAQFRLLCYELCA
jgi:hypothetical protein